MEPLNDDELDRLLSFSVAPPFPPRLESKIFPPRRFRWWRWLFNLRPAKYGRRYKRLRKA